MSSSVLLAAFPRAKVQKNLLLASCTISAVIGPIGTVHAQSITPAADGTGTVVNIDGTTYTIEGGALSGDGQNLFHSFETFGLTQQEIANFLSNPEIRNILGRVGGGIPSQIDGLLQITGGTANLYLMNPAGIVLGPNAQLNVPGSFAATTATSTDFADGEFSAWGDVDYQALVGTPQSFGFTANTSGAVVNTADLAVTAGNNLALIGSTVVNTGTLTAPGGNITVTAVPGTQQIKLSQEGLVLALAMNADDLAQMPADQPIAASLPELVTGGNAEIAATIQVDEQGRVWLTESQTMIPETAGTAIASGTLTTSSDTTPGGTLQVLGEQVALLEATVDASGTQGGDVFIGGDLQGGGELPTSQFTVVDDTSVIQADAITNGDGGQVIVWADDTTQFAGTISARGGDTAGDGGFVEVSGLETLNFIGEVDTNAPNGAPGTLLLDPADITITAGGAPGGGFDGNVLFGDAGPTVISEAQIEGLAGNTNVTIQATNSITIQPMTGGFLTFQPGVGTIEFEAGGTFLSNSAIRTNFRDISISAGSITFQTGAFVDIEAGVGSAGALTGDGGSINLTSTNGGISFESIATISGLGGTPGNVQVSVSSGSSLDFGSIDTTSGQGGAPGNITINGVAQPGGLLTPDEIVGGVGTGGSTPGPSRGTPSPGGGTPGSGQTVNVNGAIVNIGSAGTRGSSTSLSNIADPNFGITIPAVGSLPGLTITPNNAQMLNAWAQGEILQNELAIDWRRRRIRELAREAQSGAFATETQAEILLDSAP